MTSEFNFKTLINEVCSSQLDNLKEKRKLKLSFRFEQTASNQLLSNILL